jgi:hypothetical protein
MMRMDTYNNMSPKILDLRGKQDEKYILSSPLNYI